MPPDPGDNAGGQLKPIAEFKTAAVPASQQPAAPSATVAKAAADAAQRQAIGNNPQSQHNNAAHNANTTLNVMHTISPLKTSNSAAANPTSASGTHRILRTPGLSLKHPRNNTQTVAEQNLSSRSRHRSTPFTDIAVIDVWNNYIKNHPTEHVLINTMRVSLPTPRTQNAQQPDTNPQQTHTSRQYTVTVDNDIQVAEINAHLADIKALMANSLDNDFIEITVIASDGPASPATWNEREVLAHMLENHTDFKSFFNTLDLSQL